MTVKKLIQMYHCDPARVSFTKSENGLYRFSQKSARGCYIIEQNGNYSVVSEKGNQIVHFGCDLSGIEEGRLPE